MSTDALTRSASSADTAADVGYVQYCTFWVDDLYLGIDALGVQEVLRSPGLTPVPLAPPAIRGLINLRGQIVTAVDLGARLGREPRERRMNVVVRALDGSVGLLVDRIDDVVNVAHGDHEAVPTTLTGAPRTLIKATCTLPHALLLILDAARVTAVRRDGD